MNEKNIQHIQEINKDALLHKLFTHLETTIAQIYNTGYREMPYEKRQLVLNTLKGEQTGNEINEPLKPLPNANAQVAAYATISNGTFTERIDVKEKESYGNSIFNTKTQTIESIIKKENTIDEVLFGWAIDPLAYKYPSMSPYSAFGGNPILFFDGDGRAIRFYLINFPAHRTFETQLSQAFSGKIKAKIDEHTGLLSISKAPNAFFSTKEAKAFAYLTVLIGLNQDINIKLVQRGDQFSNNSLIDRYDSAVMDVTDIQAISSAYPAINSIIHTFQEQKLRQTKNRDNYADDHKEAEIKELDITGLVKSNNRTDQEYRNDKGFDPSSFLWRFDLTDKDGKVVNTFQVTVIKGEITKVENININDEKIIMEENKYFIAPKQDYIKE